MKLPRRHVHCARRRANALKAGKQRVPADLKVRCPPTAWSLPICRNGEFGSSRFQGQLSTDYITRGADETGQLLGGARRHLVDMAALSCSCDLAIGVGGTVRPPRDVLPFSAGS